MMRPGVVVLESEGSDWVVIRTSPKSATLTRPPSVISTFSGLTSRCTRCARCAAPSAASTGSITSSAARTENAPRSASTSRSVRPGTYSIARNALPPSALWSKTLTTLGCESRATALASRMNRSANAGSPANCGCITLSATTRSSRVSVPL